MLDMFMMFSTPDKRNVLIRFNLINHKSLVFVGILNVPLS